MNWVRVGVDGLVVLARGITHTTGREIDKACLSADKGEGDIVLRHVLLVVFRPLYFLHAEDGLEVDDIGPSALYALRCKDAVVVEYEAVLGACLCYAVNHGCGLLVVAIEEVDLKASDAHLLILLAGCLQLLVEHVEDTPEDDADVARLGVFDEFGEVDFRNGREHVARLRFVPAFVENDVFEVVLCSKVDVMLVGLVVDASLEVDTLQSPVVPPVPSYMTWANP